MGWVFAAAGIALGAALVPHSLARLSEGFFETVFGRKRSVWGHAWTLAALGITLPATIQELVLLARSSYGSLECALSLLGFSIALFFIWGLQLKYCLQLPNISNGTLTYRSLAKRVNRTGVVCFFGVVFYMFLFGERIWRLW